MRSFLLVPVLAAAASCLAAGSGPDLTGSWSSVSMLAPAPKANQQSTVEGLFVVRNGGDRSAPPSRVAVYLRADGQRVDVNDRAQARLLAVLDVPELVAGQKWNGRMAHLLDPGQDAAGLRLTMVLVSRADVNPANNEATSEPIRGVAP